MSTSSCLVSADTNWLAEATRIIHSGGVVALPYERLFGLAADALNPRAVAKVASIKSRPQGSHGPQPIAVILPNHEALKEVAIEINDFAKKLADRHWPGLLTMLLLAKKGLPPPLVGESGLIGARLPGPSPAAQLSTHSGLILTATSANRAGAPDALCHEDVIGLSGVDLIIQGTVAGAPGSTVLDVSGDTPNVLRQGAVKLEGITS